MYMNCPACYRALGVHCLVSCVERARHKAGCCCALLRRGSRCAAAQWPVAACCSALGCLSLGQTLATIISQCTMVCWCVHSAEAAILVTEHGHVQC